MSRHFKAVRPSAQAYLLAEYVLARGAFAERKPGAPVLVVTSDVAALETLKRQLEFFLAGAEARLLSYPPWDVLPFEALSPSQDVTSERLLTLSTLIHREEGSAPLLILTTPQALLRRTLSAAQLERESLVVTKGAALSRDALIGQLDRTGYVRNSLVEERGQYAVRGAVIDFYSPGEVRPVRLEWYGETLESVRDFDLETQRSFSDLAQVRLIPVREVLVLDADLEQALRRLRARASELEIPARDIEPLEEALRERLPWPGVEHLLPLLSSESGNFFNYFPADGEIVLVDTLQIENQVDTFIELLPERAKRAYTERTIFPEAASAFDPGNELLELLRAREAISFSTLSILGAGAMSDEDSEIDSRTLKDEFGISTNRRLERKLKEAKRAELPLEPLAEEIKLNIRQGRHVAIVVSHLQRRDRIQHLLSGYDLGVRFEERTFQSFRAAARMEPSTVSVLTGALEEGLLLERDRILLIAEADIFPGMSSRPRSAAAKSVKRILNSLSQLKEGDYVVHVDHGIGLYRGLREMAVGEAVSDFLVLEYAENSKLFVPVEQIAKLQKYVGAEGKAPVLTRLGGNVWEKTKKKVQQNVVELAGQLVNLYASREIVPGHAFGKPDEEDFRFADSFEFEETPDQARAIEEVLSDMALSKPMDRLVCGDVGYGKTEVAIRAAFKAVNAGKQVAVLVPTTILAEQHLATFQRRFEDFPFVIRRVSRFAGTEENRETVALLAEGKVDVIIGTHRLLQNDVKFSNLGLMIIDEEHRFGVAHKEKLKRYRQEVDVLTLTATPIPRTMHMSLLGIRDLSIIETPPTDRQVIRTYVAPFSDEVVREAIQRELARQGQVFYIYNRVQGIQLIAEELKALVPEARILVGHGQMNEKELEDVMQRFIKGECDVLLSTTIVESGLDISNANTIIIRNADRFGLAELYQLRGRVGRSSRRAYSYLFVSDPKTLGADAKKRLEVMQSLDDLGQGFRLALQDMEIRGAGNLLGKDQSGQVNVLGFELYTHVLREAVLELRRKQRGEKPTAPQVEVDPELQLGFAAHIPPNYIPDVAERLLLYQRLVQLENRAQGFSMMEEITDRFGHVPKEVEELVELMVLRGFLKRALVTSGRMRDNAFTFSFHPQAALNPERLVQVVRSSGGKISMSPSMAITLKFEVDAIKAPDDLIHELEEFFKAVGYDCRV